MNNFPQKPLASSTLAELDRLIDAVVELAQAESSEPRFLGELLSAVVQAIAGLGGFVWPVPVVSGGMPLARVGFPADLTEGASLPAALSEHAGHRELLSRVSRDCVPARVLPGRQDTESVDAANPTESVLLVAPIGAADSPCDAVLEVLITPGGSPATQQSALDVVSAFAEAARLFFDRKRLAELRLRVARADTWDDAIAVIHASLDPVEVAFAVANEGRGLLGCDRLSVVSIDRLRPRLLAASGQDAIDRRAPLTTALEELARAVAAAREPVSYPAENARLPPRITTAAQAVCDLASARELLIWPLIRETGSAESNASAQTRSGKSRRDEPEILGALVAERWTESGSETHERRLCAPLARQAVLALGNCREHRSLPFYSVLAPLGRLGWWRSAPRGWLLAAAATLLAGLALLVPAELYVTGAGVLQPRDRVDVFAPADGIVADVLTAHGRDCAKGGALLRLTRSELEFEQTRISGELLTAQRRLASIEASRLQSAPRNAGEREKFNQIAAEEEELRETEASLLRQQAILERQEAELIVRSPLDGQVVTWDVEELLAARPVQRGQQLLTVADLRGPWILEVDVPDDRIGPVLAARKSGSDTPLPVSFMLATEPGTTYMGSVSQIAVSAEPDLRAGQRVRVTVHVPEEAAVLRRPGAVVVPRIHCGRFPLGYVLFHTAWEAFQKHVLF